MERTRYDDPDSLVCPLCQRRGRVLDHALPVECPACQGTGFVKMSYYRAIQRAQKLVRKTYPEGVRCR